MSTSPSSPPKRPRLSLQIKAISTGPSTRTSRSLAAAVDIRDPTTFNTLSNVYATAIDRSTPTQEKPPTAFGARTTARSQTLSVGSSEPRSLSSYVGPYLDTPLSAQPASPAVSREIILPSTMTATPPLSAIASNDANGTAFTYDWNARSASRSSHPTSTPRRSTTLPGGAAAAKPPYTHPRTLRSILRNSPLPAPLVGRNRSPISPRRQSRRLQERAARRVAYNSPLCQTITTSKYTRSHIDLLTGDDAPSSPYASSTSSTSPGSALDSASVSSTDDFPLTSATVMMTPGPVDTTTRDGGQTPGPFEEMRRRLTTSLEVSSPLSPSGVGVRKRSSTSGGGRRKEKKRRWVWTIGEDGEDPSGASAGASGVESPGGSLTAAAAAAATAAAAAKRTPTVASDGDDSNDKTPKATVPVLAIPSPRPRTRLQAALQTVPVIVAPVPPVRRRTGDPAVSTQSLALSVAPAVGKSGTQETVPFIAVPMPRARPRTRQQTPEPTARTTTTTPPATISPPSMRARGAPRVSATFLAPVVITCQDTSLPVEPPTPSADSTMSQDSVFDRGNTGAATDAEMSDVSSLASETEPRQYFCNVTDEAQAVGIIGAEANDDGGDDGDEMNMDTPIVTEKPAAAARLAGSVNWEGGMGMGNYAPGLDCGAARSTAS